MTLKVEKDECVGDFVVVSDIKADDSTEPHVIQRFETHQEAIIFAHENKMIGTKWENLEKLIEVVFAEHKKLSEEANKSDLDVLGLVRLPHEIRWKLHVLACSVEDYTFWSYKMEEGQEWYKVIEVESGVDAEGVSPRHALENYFNHVFPDPLNNRR